MTCKKKREITPLMCHTCESKREKQGALEEIDGENEG
jgi:hypothetical protein